MDLFRRSAPCRAEASTQHYVRGPAIQQAAMKHNSNQSLDSSVIFLQTLGIALQHHKWCRAGESLNQGMAQGSVLCKQEEELSGGFLLERFLPWCTCHSLMAHWTGGGDGVLHNRKTSSADKEAGFHLRESEGRGGRGRNRDAAGGTMSGADCWSPG